MPNARITNAIDLSIESAVGTIPDDDVIGVPILRWLSRKSSDVPPWWSFARDMKLRAMWKDASHLSMLMYTAQSLLVGVPLRIEARDQSITSHVEQAELLTDILMNVSEFGQSLYVAKRKFIEDYLGTDNGGFMEVIGDGPATGPIDGLPLAVRHLDSSFCWRTANPEYPVVYHDPIDGKAYKLHRSRVIFMSQMTSPLTQMNGVGFCAISRSIQFAQHLYDIYIHKQEKLGSRPISTILVGAGFKGSQIMKAVQMAQMAMNNEGLLRYSKAVGIGTDNPDATITPLTLNNFDPFDEETAVSLAIYGLAACFGIPIQEVWPTGGRAGREGSVQESRQRGKLPAEFHAELELQLEQKYLPPRLRAVHDYRDDYQDERRAVNQDIRARNRERDIGDGSITIRTSRQMMLEAGDLTREQFTEMEVEDGRLEDGRPLSILFYTEDEYISSLLDTGVENPTNVMANNPDDMLEIIAERIDAVLAELGTAASTRKKKKATLALNALINLREDYERALMIDVRAARAEALAEEAVADMGGEDDGGDEGAPADDGGEQAEQVEPIEPEEEQGQGEIRTRNPSESRESRVEGKDTGYVSGPW